MGKSLVLTFFAVLISVSAAHADFYRWVDKDGKEYFTNEPQKIPQEYRANASKVTPDASRVSVEEKQAVRPAKTAKTTEHKDKYGRGEEYWRKKAASLRLKLHEQQDDYQSLLKELSDRDRNPTGRRASKSKKRASLEQKKTKLEKEIAKTKRRLEVDLPEEARKADAYPGWIRE